MPTSKPDLLNSLQERQLSKKAMIPRHTVVMMNKTV